MTPGHVRVVRQVDLPSLMTHNCDPWKTLFSRVDFFILVIISVADDSEKQDEIAHANHTRLPPGHVRIVKQVYLPSIMTHKCDSWKTLSSGPITCDHNSFRSLEPKNDMSHQSPEATSAWSNLSLEVRLLLKARARFFCGLLRCEIVGK